MATTRRHRRAAVLGIVVLVALGLGVAFWSVRAGPLQGWRIERDMRQAVTQWERAGAPLHRLPRVTDGVLEQEVTLVDAGPHLLLHVGGGPCDEHPEVRAVESDRGVALLVLRRTRGGPCTAQLIRKTVEVELASPVGQRQVFDGSSGRPLPGADGSSLPGGRSPPSAVSRSRGWPALGWTPPSGAGPA